MGRTSICAATCWLIVWVAACGSKRVPTEDSAQARAVDAPPKVDSNPSATNRAAYPAGRWRLADWSELEKSRLWVSHILIRHRKVPAHLVSFNAIGWASAPEPPARSREEALALAGHIAELAQREPQEFSQLAQRFSEDITTRDEGGSFGGITASQWMRWPEVLDAMAALEYGQVSHPVETAYGFHVFLRRSPPPPDESYSGSHIVIGHDSAPWLRAVLARGPLPVRPRAEALALAQAVYAQASSNPERFGRLVEEYSEHCDAARGGDFGEWPTTQPTLFPLAVEKLSQLEVGAIAPPIETQYGFEIVQRTARRSRVTFAMQRIQVQYDASAPSDATASESNVARYLASVAGELQRDPARFEEYQTKHCCTGTELWQEGRGSALSEQVLAQLELGEVAKRPARLEGGVYAILKRVAPGSWSPERARFELPAPARANPKRFVAHAKPAEILALGLAAVRDLELGGEVAERVLRAHAEGGFASASSDEERWSLFQQVQSNVEGLLGAARFDQYRRSVERYVEHELLKGSRARLGRLAAPRLVP